MAAWLDSTVLFWYVFYIGFAASVCVYRQWLKGTLNLFNKLVFAPVLIVFGLMDVALNYTVFMVFGRPPARCYTISSRMEQYRKTGAPLQALVATILCVYMLNPIDPAGEHC